MTGGTRYEMPSTIDFLNDGRIIEWGSTPDEVVATKRESNILRFYVADIRRIRVADIAERYCSKSDFSMKSLNSVAQTARKLSMCRLYT
jgi:hypothetical protein